MVGRASCVPVLCVVGVGECKGRRSNSHTDYPYPIRGWVWLVPVGKQYKDLPRSDLVPCTEEKYNRVERT